MIVRFMIAPCIIARIMVPSSALADDAAQAYQLGAAAHITIGREQDLSGQGPPLFDRPSRSMSATSPVSRTVHTVEGARLRPLSRIRSSSFSPVAGDMSAGVPVRSRGMTSGFGMRPHPSLGGMRFHAGIDLAAREGDGVFATAEGRVVQSGWSGGYGLAVTIDHGNGLQTRYAHLSRLGVMAGEDVRSGELVGFVGSTGRSTGPHLHYELRRFGRPIDPSGTLGR